MTRKDYVALAEALYRARPFDSSPPDRFEDVRIARVQWEFDREQIASVLAADNPRFDRQRFVKACQGEK